VVHMPPVLRTPACNNPSKLPFGALSSSSVQTCCVRSAAVCSPAEQSGSTSHSAAGLGHHIEQLRTAADRERLLRV
jgi:hypothetical protein